MEGWKSGKMEVRVERKYGIALLGFRSFLADGMRTRDCFSGARPCMLTRIL